MQMLVKWQGKGKEWDNVIGGTQNLLVNSKFDVESQVISGSFNVENHSDFAPSIIVESPAVQDAGLIIVH